MKSYFGEFGGAYVRRRFFRPSKNSKVRSGLQRRMEFWNGFNAT